jgi:tetratricopeptide (TPR) repeat protein
MAKPARCSCLRTSSSGGTASELALPRRRTIHLAIAGAIERLHAGDLGAHLAELARHYSFGAGPSAAGKTVDYAVRAARQARAVYAHQEAVSFYGLALQALDKLPLPDTSRRCDLLIELGQALLSVGDTEQALQLAEDAFACAESSGESSRSASACSLARLAMLHSAMGIAPHTPLFQSWAARASRHVDPGSLDRARACVMLGDALIVTDQRAEGWRLYREAFEIALRHDDTELLYDIATQVGGWGASPAHEAERYDIMLEALKRPKALSTETLGRFLIYEGWIRLDWGEELGWSAWQELPDLAAAPRAPTSSRSRHGPRSFPRSSRAASRTQWMLLGTCCPAATFRLWVGCGHRMSSSGRSSTWAAARKHSRFSMTRMISPASQSCQQH